MLIPSWENTEVGVSHYIISILNLMHQPDRTFRQPSIVNPLNAINSLALAVVSPRLQANVSHLLINQVLNF
ncbi:MAG: hypothetical protein V7L25_33535 [Nostoc sp.]